jgi:hypothetical protein
LSSNFFVIYSLTLSSTFLKMVFSDEFETEGRTFWPGDDPFWEGMCSIAVGRYIIYRLILCVLSHLLPAADLHAWATTDLEYYDPR